MQILKVVIPKRDMPVSCCACKLCKIKWLKDGNDCIYECPVSKVGEYAGECFVSYRHPDCPLDGVER